MTRLFQIIDCLTGLKPDLEEIALREPWAKGLIYCDMEGFAICDDGSLVLLDECGRHAYPPTGRFQVEWLVAAELVDSVLDLMQARGLMADEGDARAVIAHLTGEQVHNFLKGSSSPRTGLRAARGLTDT